MSDQSKAIFAAGCFWGIEAAFMRLAAVLRTQVGYTGGDQENPDYESVCKGNSGHAEAVLIHYDSHQANYEDLLDFFWNCHDPTQLNRQGLDIGNQYRSAIFVFNKEQESKAQQSKISRQSRFTVPIATEIVPASKFWRAEEYHQKYLLKRSGKLL